MPKTKISICIVTWNSAKYLPGLFESILAQTAWDDPELELVISVVDSGSRDSSIDFIQKHYPQVFILKNNQNLGFTKSYNQAIKMQSADYYLLLNADVVLEKDYIEKLYQEVKKDKELGSVTGKLLRAKFSQEEDEELQEIEKTDVIDSLWIEMRRDRRFINFGENEIDTGQYDKKKYVFGFSPVAGLYRHKALEKVRYEDEYLDDDFFAYKEDIDLSWRLQIAGYKALYLPTTTAYHFRGVQDNYKKYNNLNVAFSYQKKNQLVRFHSYANHLFCLLKNETVRNFGRDFFFIAWYEFRKIVYLILFDRKTLKGLGHFFKFRKKMIAKRKQVMKYNKIRAEKIRGLFMVKGKK